MNEDFRKRAFLPVVIPVAIVAVVAGVIGLYAWLLLYNTREGAAALAIVAAAGILVAGALAASQSSLGRTKQLGVGIAALAPVAVGIVIASGAFGLDPATLNVNAEPHAPEFLLAEVPPDTPTMGAVDLSSFCLPSNGSCEPTREWEVATPDDLAQFTYAFDNRDPAVEHNLALYGLPEESAVGGAADALGTDLLTPELPEPYVGPEVRAYQFEWAAEEGAEPAPPDQFYFVCTVHPTTMYGTGTFTG
jgi:hypothetical protein